MKHTPEPWFYDENRPANFYSDDDTGSIIGECGRYAFVKRSDDERRANARRIVACVNACEGSTTEDLERLGKDFVAPLINLIDQRDELLTAITEAENIAVDSIRRMRAAHVPCADLIKRTESLVQVIRAAKGGAA
ncbi:hypothetical protein [uncultured Tolumonas sp.]|uniref:hypothetical protein n=1 Tax=uncultured Tolumonas sp. TaxID=263765 RepID=UPI002A0A17E5|nr:hypothetical protein [uncultured Tolumonas sp.]